MLTESGLFPRTPDSGRGSPSAMVDLLARPTLLESATAHSFKTDGVIVPICDHGTRHACQLANPQPAGAPPCPLVHVRRLLFPHTDQSLGDCSYLSSCRRPMTCKVRPYSCPS